MLEPQGTQLEHTGQRLVFLHVSHCRLSGWRCPNELTMTETLHYAARSQRTGLLFLETMPIIYFPTNLSRTELRSQLFPMVIGISADHPTNEGIVHALQELADKCHHHPIFCFNSWVGEKIELSAAKRKEPFCCCGCPSSPHWHGLQSAKIVHLTPQPVISESQQMLRVMTDVVSCKQHLFLQFWHLQLCGSRKSR